METGLLLSQAFLEAHPSDAALILERLSSEESAALLEEVPPRVTAAVLQRMAPLNGAECLARVSLEQAGPIIATLPLDTAAGLLRRIGLETQERLLARAPVDASAPLRLLLQYPEGTAGALMDPRVLAFPPDIAVGEALARVRRSPRHALYYLYVVGRDQALVGVLNLRELMLAPPKASLASVMRPHVARLSAREDRTTIVAHPGWQEFHALPVVDDAGTFVGAIRYETLRRLEDDTTSGHQAQRALAIVLTLGELCWIGLAGMLTDLASSMAQQLTRKGSAGETDHGASC